MNDVWHIVFPQQSAEERSGRLGIAMFLQEDVQHNSASIDRPPAARRLMPSVLAKTQPVFDSADIHAHFVEMLSRTPTGFSVAQALGEEITECDAPGPNGLARHGNAALLQQFLHVPVTQGEAVIEPDSTASLYPNNLPQPY